MAGGGTGDSIHSLGDAVQSAISSDGHIGTGKIVIDGTDQAYNQQVRMCCGNFSTDLTTFYQFIHQGRPFLPEDISTCQGSIATDDNQTINSLP